MPEFTTDMPSFDDLDFLDDVRRPRLAPVVNIDSRGNVVSYESNGGVAPCSCAACSDGRLAAWRLGANHGSYQVVLSEPADTEVPQARARRLRGPARWVPSKAAPANSKRDLVLDKLRETKTDWTVAELATSLGATKLTVRKHIKELLDDGVIVVTGQTKGGRGRPATLYMLAD